MAMPPRFHNTSAYISTILWRAIALAQKELGKRKTSAV